MGLTINIKDAIGDNPPKEVTIPTDWTEMSVKYWGEMTQIVKKHFDKAESNAKNRRDTENPLLSDEDDTLFYVADKTQLNNVETLQLNRDLFCYMADIPKESIDFVDTASINKVISILDHLTEEYQPKGIKSFEFEGETYYFPSEFLRKNTYGDFIEATQLEMYIEKMKNGRFDVLPEQMAILCRRADEEYDEDAIGEKTEKFKSLKMDIVWEFGFFLTQQNERLLKLSHMYSAKNKEVV